MEKKVILQTKKISKYFYKPVKFKALDEVSFEVYNSEFITMIGKSGSGKSTLLRMIAGLEFPESGQFLFNQIDLAQTPPHLRDFGLVFQDYGLFPHLNIFDNVAFGLKMKSVKHKGHEVHKGEGLTKVFLGDLCVLRV